MKQSKSRNALFSLDRFTKQIYFAPMNLLLSITKSSHFSWLFFVIVCSPTYAYGGDTTGKTADGCTYSVINGKYSTSCPSKTQIYDQVRSGSAATSEASAPVTNYGSVPERRNSRAAKPSIQMGNSEPSISSITINPPDQSLEPTLQNERSYQAARQEKLAARLDDTYVFANLGSTNVHQSAAGSSTALGVSIGTSIDETLGVELGYAYSKQSLNLGLANRSNDGSSSTSIGTTADDSSLRMHFVTAEVLAHLTDNVKRLRPYGSLGLGWKATTLEENTVYGRNGSTLNQNSIGALAGVGTKFRITPVISLAFAVKYFIPISRADARLEQQGNTISADGSGNAPGRLAASDSALTGAGIHSILAGVQYSF